MRGLRRRDIDRSIDRNGERPKKSFQESRKREREREREGGGGEKMRFYIPRNVLSNVETHRLPADRNWLKGSLQGLVVAGGGVVSSAAGASLSGSVVATVPPTVPPTSSFVTVPPAPASAVVVAGASVATVVAGASASVVVTGAGGSVATVVGGSASVVVGSTGGGGGAVVCTTGGGHPSSELEPLLLLPELERAQRTPDSDDELRRFRLAAVVIPTSTPHSATAKRTNRDLSIFKSKEATRSCKGKNTSRAFREK